MAYRLSILSESRAPALGRTGGSARRLGIGKCTVGPTAAAIGNAVNHARGVRIYYVPLSRERIMAALLKAS